MDTRRFFAANAIVIGTIIIFSGFMWMITLAAIAAPLTESMIAFFVTISGLVFWGIGYKLNPQQSFNLGLRQLAPHHSG